ncbi:MULTISPECIES: 2-hydroxyacid dehydrogenase [Pseudomonas]|uniref:Hydroxypyruvate reductase 2 n=1 Tax=Pseudomonas hunanensis TaxID=1247546 RepID=A0ACC6KAB5_9PSED|nr:MULTISPECIES: 2-hydroxyacid dehydrogenase [Pseudomonas]MBP2260973.1 hydroxypyruvate reductase 2 [Pseudomonas sp. BP8]MDR6715338.1 hydroxypyruvate reductase 2 [Pseudomonas hunanensis]HDS1736362.1 2-hydroxyacid dehydrogenase [Pseudomonas putida]
MKPELLMLAPLLADYEAQLGERFELLRAYDEGARQALLDERPERFAALVTNGGEGVPGWLLAGLTGLRLIAVNGVGLDRIDLEQTTARGIRIATTDDILTDAVADQAVALLLALLRQVCLADRFVRQGQWRQGGFPLLGTSLRGQRVGIIGLGRIGQAIAERLQPFGVTLAYHNRRPLEGCAHAYHASAQRLAADSDILLVAAAGGAASRHLVNAEVLAALGAQGVLVNVARGSVVDEDELVARLLDGRLGGAALDVFEHEPQVPEALLGLDNVVLQPHLGSATLQTRRAMAECVVRAVLQGY